MISQNGTEEPFRNFNLFDSERIKKQSLGETVFLFVSEFSIG